MADIQVRIQLHDAIPNEVSGFELADTSITNNASATNVTAELATTDNGINMKSWANAIKDADGNVVSKVVNGETISQGLLSLSDGVVGGADTKLVEQNGYSGYVFGAVPESKELEVDLFVLGDNIDSIVVYGDTTAGQFPTRAYLNNDTSNVIYSDDAIWAIKFDTPANSQRITFTHWHRANYNACLTAIVRLDNTLVLDKSWLQNVESLSQSTGQPKEIYYGVTPSSGSLEILDRNGEIKDYIQDGILQPSNLGVSVYVNNNIVQNHISSDSDYEINNVLNLQLTNQLTSWDNVLFEGYSLYAGHISLYSLLSGVLNKVNISLSKSLFENNDLFQRVSDIFIPYSYMKESSVREALNKICSIGQLLIVGDSQDNIRILDARPIYDSTKSILAIPNKLQQYTPDISVIKKNKYDKVQIVYNELDYDYTEVVSFNFATHEPPAFTSIQDTDGVQYQKAVSQEVASFKEDLTLGNEELTLLYPNQLIMNSQTEFWLYSLFKITVDNPSDIITDYQDFKMVFSTNSLVGIVSSESSRVLINENDTKTIDNVIIASSEEELLSKLLNIDENGKITVKIDQQFALGVVVGKNTTTYYILKWTWMIDPDNLFNLLSLFDYSGTIKIYTKALKTTSRKYINGSGSNLIELNGNELMTDYAYISSDEGEENLRYYISKNILEDYKDGISSVNVSVACLDVYDINGNKVKSFSDGEIIEVGDVVRIDKDNFGNSRYKYANGNDMYFRVTGRNFRYAGVPMLDLELQEVKII